MSSIDSSVRASLLTPVAQPARQAPAVAPSVDSTLRHKREITPNPAAETGPQWTLQPVPEPSSDGDHQLQNALGTSAMRNPSDSLVQIPPDSLVYAGFCAVRSAFNTADMKAWLMSKGLALDTVVVGPDTVTGLVMGRGGATRKTFTLGDDSGWWQVSARLRAAVSALDVAGKGVVYMSAQSELFSRNALLRWYGITPPTQLDELDQVREALMESDWSGLSSELKNRLRSASLASIKAINLMDERAHLASGLRDFVRDKSDDEAISLANVRTPISPTAAPAVNAAVTAPIAEVLISQGLSEPKTGKEVRNVIRWLLTQMPPAPALGDYAQLISQPWAPGLLSQTDKRLVPQLIEDDGISQGSTASLLRALDFVGVLDDNTPEALRAQADHFLEQILGHRTALHWGEAAARSLSFQGASGAFALSAREAKQMALAAVLLQIDPDAGKRRGLIAGYDVYRAANSGMTMAEVRAQVEAHLSAHPLLDAQTVPLIAHLFLASNAPEFLVRDIAPTLRVGSTAWADLRLGVAFAERQGGAGCSRAMNYDEILALSRLDASTPEEAALLDNYGVDTLLDWGVMQGVYPRPQEERYTPQLHQQAAEAFQAQRDQLLQALEVFRVPLPTRRELATLHLKAVFPELSLEQLKALKVHIADRDELRNMALSEPRARSLIETYMTGELVKDRWMLLAPGEQAPQPAPAKTPSQFNRGLSPADRAVVDRNVQALNLKIANLPDVQAQVPGKVDAYLADLKQGLNTATRKLIAELPLADRQALEYGSIELFTLREQTDAVLIMEETPEQVEEGRGRKGTLIRCAHNGKVSYFEVFAPKMLIVKREDLPDQLALGGTLEDFVKTYGAWAPTDVQKQNGAVEPFDFNAYTSDAMPRPGVSSPRIIIEKLADTLPATAPPAGHDSLPVPNSFSSARTEAIVQGIMEGNFIHHRDSVLKIAQGELPLEQQRQLSRANDRMLLSMIPFVGAIMELAKGNIVEGTRALVIDTVGALLSGAGSTIRPLVQSTKVVAPFGAKAFRVLEKGVTAVSAFLNPLDGGADLLGNTAKGVFVLPNLLKSAPKITVLTNMFAIEGKLRAFLGVHLGLRQLQQLETTEQKPAHNGHNHAVPVHALQVNGQWYATNPQNGAPMGTPLDGFTLSSAT